MRYYLLYHDAACHPCNSGRASYQAKKCSLKPCEENSDCDFSSLCKDTICTDLKDVDGDCVNTFECAGFCKEAAFVPTLAPGLRPPHAPGPKCADFVDIDGECTAKEQCKDKDLKYALFCKDHPSIPSGHAPSPIPSPKFATKAGVSSSSNDNCESPHFLYCDDDAATCKAKKSAGEICKVAEQCLSSMCGPESLKCL